MILSNDDRFLVFYRETVFFLQKSIRMVPY